ncbi:MAG: alpha/beta fold hydrolase [Halodesulfurarchaeum sp.]
MNPDTGGDGRVRATFVLVHGAYHGRWCWFKVVPELEERGHSVATVELPAHGIDTTPVENVDFEGYVDTVIDRIEEQDGPVVLVGHSMSGMVISQVAERRPDAVNALVYLTAYIPGNGESMLDQRVDGSPISKHFTADEENGVGVVAQDALTDLFYADCSPADRELGRSLVRPEPLDPLSEPVALTPERFGAVPRVFVFCENDRTITPEKQRSMLEEHGANEVVELDSTHSPFLSMPGKTADALETALSEL